MWLLYTNTRKPGLWKPAFGLPDAHELPMVRPHHPLCTPPTPPEGQPPQTRSHGARESRGPGREEGRWPGCQGPCAELTCVAREAGLGSELHTPSRTLGLAYYPPPLPSLRLQDRKDAGPCPSFSRLETPLLWGFTGFCVSATGRRGPRP